MSTINSTASPDHPITIKIALSNGENRRFKLALKELGANSLPDKLRSLLAITPTQHVVFERFSDSAGSYITLDSNNPSVYKQLYRAAKAKLKLRIKATITDMPSTKPMSLEVEPATTDRLTSHRYVPPMNPDPLKVDGATSSNTDSGSPTTTPSTAMPLAHQAATDNHRRAYVQKLRQSTLKYPSDPTLKVDAIPSKAGETTEVIKQETLKEGDDEAPVPRFFSARQHFYAEIESMARDRPNTLRSADQAFNVPGIAFTICCNNCDAGIPDAHWHCSICDDGDFDLCESCVAKGVLCDFEDHWLIKRFVKDGKVINSTTETIAPKKHAKVEDEKDVPGAFNSNIKEEELHESPDISRTCNSCVQVFDESNFVTCTVCDDYDLCIPCHVSLKHGHHPGHAFVPASEETSLDIMATNLCAPGRSIRHFAVCDGCDKYIHGVRHKCMNCPDWDYCSICFKGARHSHPGHRFVPLYEPIPQMPQRTQRHIGINCDGPLCKGKQYGSYITGIRYKCAVCHDTDFCANCEALPKLHHNRTHPLIKFKTPVGSVSVTTLGKKENGEDLCTMGDQLPQTSSKATETTPRAPSANAATQVQTIAEVKPTEPEPVKEELKTGAQKPITSELQAHFIRDTVADGSVLTPSIRFEQIWTLRNPGPYAWPAGCSVRFIGGDIMFNVDPNHPSSVSDIVKATESNVINRIVEVGEEVGFAVTMRAPEREGKAISYWRLKAADGLPFGHKLWCDIDVRIAKVSHPEVKTEHIEDIAKPQDSEPGVKTEHIEDIAKVVKQEEVEHSQMIFPKLDKESPVSSTHEARTAPASVTEAEGQLLDDVETLTLDDESTTDDGFLTDEEYEMLDPSDDEWIEAKNGKN